MLDILLIDWIAIILGVGFIVISLAFFWIFSSHYRKSSERTRIQLAFLIFFLALALSRILLIYFDYFLTHLNSAEYATYVLWWKLSLVFQSIGFGGILFAAENGIFKGKDLYIFLVGFIIVMCIALLHPEIAFTQTASVLALVFALFIPAGYLYLAYKLPPSRRNIALIFIGFSIFGFGIMIVSPDLLATFPTMIHELYLLSILVQIPGFIIFAIGVKRMYFS